MRVVITGGAGLIGSWIAEELARDGSGQLVILDDFSRGRMANLDQAHALGADIQIVEGSITDRDLVHDVIRGADLVFHQAAIRITRCAEEPRTAMDVLVGGTFNVVEAASALGVSKVIAASSASVYGLAEQFPTTETHHPYDNRTIYGAAKTFNEGLLRSFNDMTGLDYIALRYFNVYGPRMDVFGVYTEVLVRWMERIEEGLPPLIFGDGQQTMDFVHARDIARANVLAARSNVTDAVFNVASGTETSLNDLAYTLLDVMDSDLTPDYGPARAVNPVSRRLADTSAAREQLGFTATTGLDDGLRELVAWWRAARADAQVDIGAAS